MIKYKRKGYIVIEVESEADSEGCSKYCVDDAAGKNHAVFDSLDEAMNWVWDAPANWDKKDDKRKIRRKDKWSNIHAV